MNDGEIERLLTRKYAQVVFNAMLDAEGNSCAFSALREEVNTVVTDDSRGAREMIYDGEYSPASLSSLLSAAKDTGIVVKYLNDDGQVRWRLRPSQLSQSQINRIRTKNSQTTAHADTSSVEHYQQRHTDSAVSSRELAAE